MRKDPPTRSLEQLRYAPGSQRGRRNETATRGLEQITSLSVSRSAAMVAYADQDLAGGSARAVMAVAIGSVPCSASDAGGQILRR